MLWDFMTRRQCFFLQAHQQGTARQGEMKWGKKKKSLPCLNFNGWTGDKPCLVIRITEKNQG
jgi:hypothetical protein